MGGAGEEGEKVEKEGKKERTLIISNLLIMLIVPLKCDPAQGDEQEV